MLADRDEIVHQANGCVAVERSMTAHMVQEREPAMVLGGENKPVPDTARRQDAQQVRVAQADQSHIVGKTGPGLFLVPGLDAHRPNEDRGPLLFFPTQVQVPLKGFLYLVSGNR
jgi:hypothetical protein